MEKQEQESWFEEMLRCNSHFLNVKMDLPKKDSDDSVEIAIILQNNNPQAKLDAMIQDQKEGISDETMMILELNDPQAKLNKMIQQTKENLKTQDIVITPYMRTQEYQIFRAYWLGLPNYIRQTIMNGGEIILAGIGNPDPVLLETFVQYSQFYLDSFCPELGLEAKIIAPEYQNQGYDKQSVIKMVGNYRLSVQPRIKEQENQGKAK